MENNNDELKELATSISGETQRLLEKQGKTYRPTLFEDDLPSEEEKIIARLAGSKELSEQIEEGTKQRLIQIERDKRIW